MPVQDVYGAQYSDKLWYRAKIIALYQQRVDERASRAESAREKREY